VGNLRQAFSEETILREQKQSEMLLKSEHRLKLLAL
jgi:hypothetical protein